MNLRSIDLATKQENKMAIHHAQLGEVVNVRSLGDKLTDAMTIALVKTMAMELVRSVMKAGKTVSERRASGENILHCLEAKIGFHAMGKSTELESGQLRYLPAAEPHSVDCIYDASFLLKIVKGD